MLVRVRAVVGCVWKGTRGKVPWKGCGRGTRLCIKVYGCKGQCKRRVQRNPL